MREQIAEDSRIRPEDAVKAISRLYLTMSSGLGSIGSELSRSFVNLEKGLHGYSAQAEAATTGKTAAKMQSSGPAGSSGCPKRH